MESFEAIIEPGGVVRLVTPISVARPTRAIVTLVDVEATLLSEKSLSDWSRSEEDEAWEHLQSGK